MKNSNNKYIKKQQQTYLRKQTKEIALQFQNVTNFLSPQTLPWQLALFLLLSTYIPRVNGLTESQNGPRQRTMDQNSKVENKSQFFSVGVQGETKPLSRPAITEIERISKVIHAIPIKASGAHKLDENTKTNVRNFLMKGFSRFSKKPINHNVGRYLDIMEISKNFSIIASDDIISIGQNSEGVMAYCMDTNSISMSLPKNLMAHDAVFEYMWHGFLDEMRHQSVVLSNIWKTNSLPTVHEIRLMSGNPTKNPPVDIERAQEEINELIHILKDTDKLIFQDLPKLWNSQKYTLGSVEKQKLESYKKIVIETYKPLYILSLASEEEYKKGIIIRKEIINYLSVRRHQEELILYIQDFVQLGTRKFAVVTTIKNPLSSLDNDKLYAFIKDRLLHLNTYASTLQKRIGWYKEQYPQISKELINIILNVILATELDADIASSWPQELLKVIAPKYLDYHQSRDTFLDNYIQEHKKDDLADEVKTTPTPR